MTPLELTTGEPNLSLEIPRLAPRDRSGRRLAACAAACDGIPTAELENGIIIELVAACVRYRDDERVREILLRLSPRKTGPVRLVISAGDDGRGADAAPEPVTESSGADATAKASTDPEPRVKEPRLEVVPTKEPSSGLSPSQPRRQTAPEKFRIGLRVRVSAVGYAMMPPTIASPTGVVFGFSRSPYSVRITRDGRTSSETFDMDFWEEDPDYRDANESIVSGIRAPFRPASERAQSSGRSGVVFLSALSKEEPERPRR